MVNNKLSRLILFFLGSNWNTGPYCENGFCGQLSHPGTFHTKYWFCSIIPKLKKGFWLIKNIRKYNPKISIKGNLEDDWNGQVNLPLLPYKNIKYLNIEILEEYSNVRNFSQTTDPVKFLRVFPRIMVSQLYRKKKI